MDHDNLPLPITETRHLPSRRPVIRRRGNNYLVRSTAKRLVESKDPKICQALKLPPSTIAWGIQYKYGDSTDDTSFRRPQIEKELRRLLANVRTQQQSREPRAPVNSSRNEEEEGRDLARSEVPLPSDRYRLVRRPTLEREEAFRVASTSFKGKVGVRQAQPTNEDAQVAQLYTLGLLYDNDEQYPEEIFDLNSIQHEAPVYTIRPAKRARKSKKAGGLAKQPSHLELSFTDLGNLGNDNTIAKYLAPPASTSGNKTIQNMSQDVAMASPPLRVIYELAGSNPSFDVDTSQPPDLVSDALSDYDCFSDSELDDDVPIQREVHENTDHPSSGAWIMLG